MAKDTQKYHPLGVSAIAYIATLYTQRRLTDALDCIELTCGLHGDSALILFAVVGEVA